MTNMKNLKLRAKAMICLLGITIFIVIAVIILNLSLYSIIDNLTNENFYNIATTMQKEVIQAKKGEKEIENVLEEKIISCAFAMDGILQNKDQSKINSLITNYVNNSGVMEINIVGNGKVIYSNLTENIGYVYEDNNSFTKVIKGESKTYMEPIRKSTVGNGIVKFGGVLLDNGYSVQVGISSEQVDKFKNEVGINTTLQRISEINDVKLIKIYDAEEKVLFSNDKKLIGTAIKDHNDKVKKSNDKNIVEYYNEELKEDVRSIKIDMELDGKKDVLDVEFSLDELEKSKNIMIIGGILTAIAIIICVSFIIAFIIKKFLKPLEQFNKEISQLASGDFTNDFVSCYVKGEDEVAQTARGICTMKKELSSLISKIKTTANVLFNSSNELSKISANSDNATKEISASVEQLALSTTMEAKDVEEMAVKADDLGNNIENCNELVELLFETVEKSSEMSEDGNNIMEELNLKTRNSNEHLHEIDHIIKDVNSYAQNAESIITLIDNIASQTNLLALNASIEAARAGEAGKGFSVVAEEIRKLSEQTTNATNNIKDIILNIQGISSKAVYASENVNINAADQNESIKATETLFKNLISALNKISNKLTNVKELSNNLNESKENIIGILGNISAVTEETAASSEEVAASIENEMNNIEKIARLADSSQKLADELDCDIQVFKI